MDERVARAELTVAGIHKYPVMDRLRGGASVDLDLPGEVERAARRQVHQDRRLRLRGPGGRDGGERGEGWAHGRWTFATGRLGRRGRTQKTAGKFPSLPAGARGRSRSLSGLLAWSPLEW